MQDEPTPNELIKAVAEFLRSDIMPKVSGATSFKLRVAINALDLSLRQMEQSGAYDAAELVRLQGLLKQDGSLLEMNETLAEKIALGEVDLQTPGLAEHLWQTTLNKLSVDQPNYASYRRETE